MSKIKHKMMSRVPSSQESENGDDMCEGEQTSSGGEEEEGTTHVRKRKFSEAQEIATTVPVLSHAERRRQKRREQQHDEKKQKRSESRQNSVWVGNLAFKTTVQDLKSFFACAGQITRVNMPMKAAPVPARKPENRGFAYVDFSTPEGKIAAIALSEQPLTGRRLLIKDGDDFTKPADSDSGGVVLTPRKATTLSKTAQKIIKLQKQPPGPTLFLGNLGFETTEANIKEMLDAHAGKKDRKSDSGTKSMDMPSAQSNRWIRRVRMGTFEDSGLCKGFAFVDFVSTEHATSALVNPKNHHLNGRKLVIEYASPDAVRRGKPKPQQETRERRGTSFAPRTIQHDNVGQQNAEEHRPPKRQRVEKAVRTRQNPNYRRVKPGAALASAQRGSVAIIPSQGKRIKFD